MQMWSHRGNTVLFRDTEWIHITQYLAHPLGCWLETEDPDSRQRRSFKLHALLCSAQLFIYAEL
jgi:hypothetical protein